jgi:Holliday junction DNA helicase RuvA
MIAKLTGRLDSAGDSHAVVDVGGVGYLLRCSARTLAALPQAGGAVSVATEMIVREDAIELFGFAETAERDWFRLLTTVQGVGARIALAMLSALPLDDLARAIATGDRAMLTRADGVGPKLAARIANELKDKVGAMGVGGMGVGGIAVDGAVAAGATASGGPASDAVSALVNLGYRRNEAESAIGKAVAKVGDSASVEGMIAAALRELAR